MNPDSGFVRIESDLSQPNEKLHVLLAYDTRATALRAMRHLEKVRHSVFSEAEIEYHLWRFDVLAISAAASAALRDAAKSELVVLAAEAVDGVSRASREWITGWLPQNRSSNVPVICLFKSYAEFIALDYSIDRNLTRAAEDGNIELFFVGGSGCLERFVPLRETLAHRAGDITSTLNHILDFSPDTFHLREAQNSEKSPFWHGR